MGGISDRRSESNSRRAGDIRTYYIAANTNGARLQPRSDLDARSNLEVVRIKDAATSKLGRPARCVEDRDRVIPLAYFYKFGGPRSALGFQTLWKDLCVRKSHLGAVGFNAHHYLPWLSRELHAKAKNIAMDILGVANHRADEHILSPFLRAGPNFANSMSSNSTRHITRRIDFCARLAHTPSLA